MPRVAPPNSCATCLRRKIKCDGSLPVCSNCRKARRECLRPAQDLKFVVHSDNPDRDSQYPSTEDAFSSDGLLSLNNELDRIKELNAKASVSSTPQAALQQPVIAILFRHYIDLLAPWYDLNDAENLFGTVVPSRALNNPVLFKAIIAFSACHESSIAFKFQDIGPVYHAACVRDLLAVMSEILPEYQGDYLAATCLLRSYEILTGTTRQQQHLLGAYSFAKSGTINLNVRGLPQAGSWNYLREEITVALECHRPVRIPPGFQIQAEKEMPDDMWANSISYILARVINFCFAKDADGQDEQDRTTRWEALAADIAGWRKHLPETFKPFSTAPKDGNPFPSIWLLRPWHIAGEQYCSIAEILLALSHPRPSVPQFGLKGRETSIVYVQHHALRVCGLAYTNDDVAARVNVFGPISLCTRYPMLIRDHSIPVLQADEMLGGRYLTQKPHQDGLIAMLFDFTSTTGWPVQSIVNGLKEYWANGE